MEVSERSEPNLDRLGGLNLSIEGLIQRDKLVISNGLDKNIPVAIVLAGGYAVDVNETVKIHCNTVKLALEIQTIK